nr:MAG TPA: hypothetical protein [Crassvirales sp.]
MSFIAIMEFVFTPYASYFEVLSNIFVGSV